MCSCHSILECCVTFSGVKLSIRSFVLLPAPKHSDRPHYEATIPNEMHQFDQLYMPSDTLYGNKYKYILAGIDAASRYKVARPLRTKQA